MITFPSCKINLGLQVTSKRPDGFHELISCFYPIPLQDILEIIPAQKLSFSQSGLSIPDDGKKNLCVRAFELLRAEYDLPLVAIHLHKIIPIGAGLGGGSSDAAYLLSTLNKIFNIGLSVEQLRSYASQLGSDCAFFVSEQPMLVTGRGETLNAIPVSLTGKFIVIVQPPVFVSTREAYTQITPKQPEVDLKSFLLNTPVSEWRVHLVNDFEKFGFPKYPAIREVKDKLYQQGALYASMSGSGSAVFGIFDSAVDIRPVFPGMFYWSSTL